MDVKATALMKLIYLEMFGHDMSWAAFHVLEVMSSPKYLQKRVGYLGAVQSFRPDTEVLMLATNLLKKDLVSPTLNTMSLPLVTLPHIITTSIAMSVLPDLLPRLSHSNPTIRKKTVVTLYRLALCYPETLRSAWPRIKERLLDDSEDPSVTAAIVNVICELSWRRPQDFLPLAPRLFELLVDSGNNWMAIKLIKLFATLTPLEPRLVKKLLPPLTSIIQTTPAMSLLYECINGIIQGGILGNGDDSTGGDEIATLCVSKLRGMIMVEGDPNLKYVALLAFNKIVLTHPYLVAQQEDVIMDCLDSPDISIRLRALDLVVGMVSSDNLVSIVSRLMRQLRGSVTTPAENGHDSTTVRALDVDSDDEAQEANIKAPAKRVDSSPPLPESYRVGIIRRVIEMCSSNNYASLVDFEWYIDVLVQLVRSSPTPGLLAASKLHDNGAKGTVSNDISEDVGDELRSVAVKVEAVRGQATRAAESILMASYHGNLSHGAGGRGALFSTAWIIGEYAPYLDNPEDTLTALLSLAKTTSHAGHLAIFLQAIPKIFARLTGDERGSWTLERKTMVSLLMARILDAIEPLAMHPDLEVQERAVEFCELLRLAAEASAGQPASTDAEHQDVPLLLTQAVPSLFSGYELKSVAPGAQYNVPLPAELDLDEPIHPRLNELLQAANATSWEESDHDEFETYYHKRPTSTTSEPAISLLSSVAEAVPPSYQQDSDETYLDADILARRRAERRERNKDDPFYIAGTDPVSDFKTPMEDIIRSDNGTAIDIDAIPIMDLNIDRTSPRIPETGRSRKAAPAVARQLIQVAADETIPTSGTSTPRNYDSESALDPSARSRRGKSKNQLLFVDSSSIGALSLETDGSQETQQEHDQQREDIEMAKAIREVERLRLEMQRANERIQAAQGVPPEGTVVKKKVKKKKKVALGDAEEGGEKPKKKKAVNTEVIGDGAESSAVVVKKKRPKKKVPVEVGENGP
jgi:AP-3 complex subunit delta-1